MDTHNFIFEGGGTRSSLFDQAVSRLEDLIDSGHFRAGEKLPSERELVDRLGISRSVLREALRVLEYRGLIAIMQGKGVYVRKPGLRTAIEPIQRLLQDGSITLGHLMQARRMLEPQIARIASVTIQAAQLKKLEGCYEDMVRYLEYQDRYLDADKEFHSTLAVATANPVMVILIWPIVTMFAGFLDLFYQMPRTPHKVIAKHGPVLQAVRDRDPEAAEATMRAHLDEVAELFKNYVDIRIFPDGGEKAAGSLSRSGTLSTE